MKSTATQPPSTTSTPSKQSPATGRRAHGLSAMIASMVSTVALPGFMGRGVMESGIM
ncbi:hypothetical protein M5E87_21205 [Flavonifractor plautii]|nr:hypothetical protein M5E87_21205 [Flavonifractor plautii]